MNTQNPNKFLNIFAALMLAGFSVFVFKELSSILIPFVLAVIIAFVFEPFYIWLMSKKIPSAVAILLIVILIIIIANISSVFILASVNSFSADFTKYESKFIEIYHSILTTLKFSDNDIKNLNEQLKISNLLQDGFITSFIANFFKSFLGIFSDFILILFYVIFLLSELGSIKQRLRIAFPDEKGEKIVSTLDAIFRDVRRYISGKTIISFFLGVISGFILWVFGVDFYFIWGFLIFLMHFIPSIGALIAIALPATVMFLQFDNIFTPVIVISLLIVIQNVVGNIVEPKIIGHHLNISPLLLLLALFLGGYVWGIVGMVLSVPIVSMIKIILSNFESTKPLAIMMSYKN